MKALRPVAGQTTPSRASKPALALLPFPLRSGLLAHLLLKDTLKRTRVPGKAQPVIILTPEDLWTNEQVWQSSTPVLRTSSSDEPKTDPVPLAVMERIVRLADTSPMERLLRRQTSVDELVKAFLDLNTSEDRQREGNTPPLPSTTLDLLDVYSLLKTAFVTNTLSSPFQRRLIFGLETAAPSARLTFASPQVARFEARLLEGLTSGADKMTHDLLPPEKK